MADPFKDLLNLLGPDEGFGILVVDVNELLDGLNHPRFQGLLLLDAHRQRLGWLPHASNIPCLPTLYSYYCNTTLGERSQKSEFGPESFQGGETEGGGGSQKDSGTGLACGRIRQGVTVSLFAKQRGTPDVGRVAPAQSDASTAGSSPLL